MIADFTEPLEDVLAKALGRLAVVNSLRWFRFLLDLHCTYTRDQLLLVALNFLTPATAREGVKRLPERQLDVFFIMLNKANKDYSPTTMHHDYSINENLLY